MIASQEEEESPAEGSKDEPGEQVELKEDGEAPVKDTSQPPPPEPKGDTAPEGEKAPEEENGDKAEAQVSCGSKASVDPEAKGAGAYFASCPAAKVEGPEGSGLFLTFPTLPTQKPSENGAAGPEGVPPAPEEEKKQKPARKQRMVEEIGVELVVLDLPDLLEDELARSMQK